MLRHRPFTTAVGSNAGNLPSETSAETSPLPVSLLIGSALYEPDDFSDLPLALTREAVADCRFEPSPSRKSRRWELPAAFLLHAAIIALALISFPSRMSLEPPSQSGVSVVFQNSGAQQSSAPPAQHQGQVTVAQVPPAPAASPPPPPLVTTQAPEMDLNIPQDLFSQMELPPPAEQAQPQHVQNSRPPRPHTRPTHQQYQVMNNMSFGSQSSGQPAPPMPNAKHGLNLQLSQSDLNALNTPQISVQGEIGSDWMSGFNKWVNEHTYYPRAAVEQGQQGTSVIQFTVHRDGHVTDLHLLSSAGSPFLDQAWLGIFAQNNVPPFPAGTKSDTIKVTASLQYELIP